MSLADALRVTEAQLLYWQQECEAARLTNDLARIARCEKFIAQCEFVIAALRNAQSERVPDDAQSGITAWK